MRNGDIELISETMTTVILLHTLYSLK